MSKSYKRRTGKSILVHCVCLLNYLFKSNRIKQRNKPVLCYSFQTKSEQQQRIYLFWYDVLLIFSKMYKLVLIFWLISNAKSNPLTQSDEYSYYIDGDEEYSASYRLFVFRRHSWEKFKIVLIEKLERKLYYFMVKSGQNKKGQKIF